MKLGKLAKIQDKGNTTMETKLVQSMNSFWHQKWNFVIQLTKMEHLEKKDFQYISSYIKFQLIICHVFVFYCFFWFCPLVDYMLFCKFIKINQTLFSYIRTNTLSLCENLSGDFHTPSTNLRRRAIWNK